MLEIKGMPIVCLSAALLILSTQSPSVLCQSPQGSNTQWGLNKGQNSGGSSERLKEAPELPQLPVYSGKSKFVQGTVQKNEEGWLVYRIDCLTKEPPKEVLGWYRNAFNMYQWSTFHAGGTTITAGQKNGNMCSIIVSTSAEPGYPSKLAISYSIPPSGMPSSE